MWRGKTPKARETKPLVLKATEGAISLSQISTRKHHAKKEKNMEGVATQFTYNRRRGKPHANNKENKETIV